MADLGALTPIVRFVREDEKLEDAFGGHTRLADAIRDALEADPTLEVIGLFGAWGSGKSRVVKMLESRMTSDTTRFFTYDAWVHQSDAPRRAFLEELIRYLELQKLADAKHLQDALGKLLKKTERVEVESSPQVSIGFGLVLAMLLLAPIAGQFLRTDWMTPRVGDWFVPILGREFTLVFVAAFWIALLPFAVLMVINAIRVLQRICGKDTGGGLTALFANKATEVRRDLKRTDPEPTALEFQKYFRDLLDLVGKSGARRLVFVIDNLDRLPDQELMALWSSIRGLFHGEAHIAAANSPTLLLPLDFAAVERLYENKPDVAQGFADKTFDLVFRVPTPVNSLWQGYLRDRMKYVFGAKATPDWMDVAARILEEGDVDSRLPRAINIYVNELATLWLQWRHEDVSFAAIAYYAAKRRELESQPWRSLQQQITWMAEFDPHWTRGVAAIRYGAPPETAAQILIEQPLRDAIVKFDQEAFEALSRQEGFGTVLRRAMEPYRTNATNLPVSHAALLMATLDGGMNYGVRLAWTYLPDGLRNDAWQLSSERDVQALSHILENNTRPARARARAAFRDKLQYMSAGQLKQTSGSFVQALLLLAESASEDGEPFEPVSIPDDPSLALVMAQELGPRAPLVAINVSDLKLGPELVTYKLAQGRPIRPLLKGIIAWRPDFDWSSVLSAAASSMSDSNLGATTRICELLGELWGLAPQARPALTQTLSMELLLHRLMSMVEARDIEKSALVSAAMLLSDVPAAWLAGVWEHLGGEGEYLNLFDEALSRFAPELSIEELIERAVKQRDIAPIVGALVRRRVSTAPGEVAPGRVASKVNLYLHFLPPAMERNFWDGLLEAPEFWNALRIRPYELDDLEAAGLFIAQSDGRSWAKFAHEFMADRLNAATANDWAMTFEKGGPLWDKLIALQDSNAFQPSRTVIEGLTSSAASLAAKTDLQFEQRWFEMARRLRSTAQKLVYRTLANRMLEAGSRQPIRLLRAGGRPMLKILRSQKRAEPVLRRLVVPVLARPAEVQWLAQHATAIAATIAGAPEGAIASALQDIERRAALASEQPEYQKALCRLAGAMRAIVKPKSGAK